MNKIDRLYELLPSIYRQTDFEQQYALRDLLRVIAEQVNIVESDIRQLYENWFIETCDDWVVPYIGDLIGYEPVHEAGEPGDPRKRESKTLNKILTPRREVANVIGYRRRKGTLALLELLANNVAGWPARAVEFYKLLGGTQSLNHFRAARAQSVNLRDVSLLNLINGPFTGSNYTVDVRRANSRYSRGLFNIGSVALFVWRLKSYSVSKTPAYCFEDAGPECYLFNALGHDTQLFNAPLPEPSPTHIANQLNLPTPISRRAFEEPGALINKKEPKRASPDYYDRSVAIYLIDRKGDLRLFPRENVIPANLSDWHRYRPAKDHVAVDPVLGRIVFPTNQKPRHGVVVSYNYAFSADIGGGEYERTLSQPDNAKIYRVGRNEQFRTLKAALLAWETEQPKPQAAVIEIQDSGIYTEQLNVELKSGEYLQIRAAQQKRPIIRLLDYLASLPDAFKVQGQKQSRFVIDGLLISGRGLQVNGLEDLTNETTVTPSTADETDLCDVTIRHCTLVPGWSLQCDCEPQRPNDPSIELEFTRARVNIDHSITGAITVEAREPAASPEVITITDSIVDATSEENLALSSSRGGIAYTALTVRRSTIIGQIQTHSIQLAENSIFYGAVLVARKGSGCMRFCYVPPGSRTPRRYECQPDQVIKAVAENITLSSGERESASQTETERVRPRFNSLRYGNATYCQLSEFCAEEIARGADDESEMGVFHDLYQPQRAANLRARLDEYTPAGTDAGVVYAN